MRKFLISLMIITIGSMPFVASSTCKAAEIKGAVVFNYQDGEKKPCAAVELKSYKDFALDLWVSDVDDLVNLENDWEAGLAVAYKVPIQVIKGIDVGLGYAIGGRQILTHDSELIHGAYLSGTIRF